MAIAPAPADAEKDNEPADAEMPDSGTATASSQEPAPSAGAKAEVPGHDNWENEMLHWNYDQWAEAVRQSLEQEGDMTDAQREAGMERDWLKHYFNHEHKSADYQQARKRGRLKTSLEEADLTTWTEVKAQTVYTDWDQLTKAAVEKQKELGITGPSVEKLKSSGAACSANADIGSTAGKPHNSTGGKKGDKGGGRGGKDGRKDGKRPWDDYQQGEKQRPFVNGLATGGSHNSKGDGRYEDKGKGKWKGKHTDQEKDAWDAFKDNRLEGKGNYTSTVGPGNGPGIDHSMPDPLPDSWAACAAATPRGDKGTFGGPPTAEASGADSSNFRGPTVPNATAQPVTPLNAGRRSQWHSSADIEMTNAELTNAFSRLARTTAKTADAVISAEGFKPEVTILKSKGVSTGDFHNEAFYNLDEFFDLHDKVSYAKARNGVGRVVCKTESAALKVLADLKKKLKDEKLDSLCYAVIGQGELQRTKDDQLRTMFNVIGDHYKVKTKADRRHAGLTSSFPDPATGWFHYAICEGKSWTEPTQLFFVGKVNRAEVCLDLYCSDATLFAEFQKRDKQFGDRQLYATNLSWVEEDEMWRIFDQAKIEKGASRSSK